MEIDPKLEEYATVRQWELLCGWKKYKTSRAASEALGVTQSSFPRALAMVNKRARQHMHTPVEDAARLVADPYVVAGRSTLYGEDGEQKLQWVKTKLDSQQQGEAMREFIAALGEDIRGLADPVAVPVGDLNDDYLAAYVVGDAHIGMYAWGQETRDADFDSDIAQREIKAAIDYLVDCSRPSKQALFVNTGDFIHGDSAANQTTSGTPLDVDTRYGKVIRVAAFALRYCIESLLRKHEHVTVINAKGNHDTSTAEWLNLTLAMFYEREPRVTIQDEPGTFNYFVFGKNLIGVNHGDKIKTGELDSIMASHKPIEWGASTHRMWWLGHVHHETVKELRGCHVETFSTLAPKDSWHAGQAYQSKRRMNLIMLHREHGPLNRAICPIGVI